MSWLYGPLCPKASNQYLKAVAWRLNTGDFRPRHRKVKRRFPLVSPHQLFLKKVENNTFENQALTKQLSFLHKWTILDKSWDSFAFLGRFPIYKGPASTLNPQTKLDVCIHNFFQVSTLYRLEGRENCKKILKRMHCSKREPRNDRKI